MTLNDFIENLESIRDRYDNGGDFEIKTALQPSYPMSGHIQNICADPDNETVYLASSDNEDYLSNSNEIWNESEIYSDEDQ